MRKLLLLGGLRYLIPVIETAHRLGLYVITCDYLPDNVAHRYSDEFWNISILDKDAVLVKAQESNIDGVMSFACDPGVVTAAYIAEKMELPFQCSYNSAVILQDKGLFRKFLSENGFNCPKAESFDNVEGAIKKLSQFRFPIIVKPVDSAGSKGVTKIEDTDTDKNPELVRKALKFAKETSICGRFIVEEYLTFKGCHSSADSFSTNGKISFITYSDQLFDSNADNPFTPSQIIWPSSMDKKSQDELTGATQRLFNLLGMKTGIYNIETCVDVNDKPYIMEVSPRGGGCKIAEIQEMAYGVKLIENEVRKAVRLPLISFDERYCDRYWCEFVVHSAQEGVYKGLDIEDEIKKKYLRLLDISVKPGDIIHRFTGANMALGDLFLRFDNREELNQVTKDSSKWIKIKFDES